MNKSELFEQLRSCINKYNFNSQQTNSSNTAEAARLYRIIFIEKSSLFPSNPSSEADRSSLAMMNSCGNCEERIFRALRAYYIKNKK